MKTKILWAQPLLTLTLSVFLVACNQNKWPEKTYVRDSEYLAEVENDPRLGISLQPPLQWMKAPLINPEVYSKALKEVSHYPLEVRSMFLNNNIRSMILISDIHEATNADIQKLRKEYKTLLNPKEMWDEVRASKVKINDLTADEYITESDVLIGYKLLFTENTDQPFQVDFFLPKSYMTEDTKEMVAAFLGSIEQD